LPLLSVAIAGPLRHARESAHSWVDVSEDKDVQQDTLYLGYGLPSSTTASVSDEFGTLQRPR